MSEPVPSQTWQVVMRAKDPGGQRLTRTITATAVSFGDDFLIMRDGQGVNFQARSRRVLSIERTGQPEQA